VLDYTSFRSLLAATLDLDLEGRGPDTLLADDLGFDSLTMAEVSVLFANDGIELPDELLTELRTLADLHHYFNVLGQPAQAVGDTTGAAGRTR
jgi:acyl carrier protein